MTSKAKMNLRLEAENRVERQRIDKTKLLEKQTDNSTRSRRARPKNNVDVTSDSTENMTPMIAALAETDYSLNGSRARCTGGEFIGPRWIPDKEIYYCFSCNVEFDWWTRRHHCRHCGKIFCSPCSSCKSLLPYAFGLRDPQRTCFNCHELLKPQQTALTSNIANHARANTVDSLSYSLRRYLNFPVSLTLGSEIRKASYSTYNLCQQSYYVRDKTIPLGLLSGAKGLVFITAIKGGLMFAPHFGTGLVIALLPDGTWSAPSALAVCGLSYGPLIGAQVTDYVLILSSDDAVAAFTSGGQASLGGEVDLTIGPFGRCGSADMTFGDGGCAAVYSYSHSRGLYAGVSLDGSIIISRSDVNHRFYGRVVTPSELLNGSVPPPRAARPLYDALQSALSASSQPVYSRIVLQPIRGGSISSQADQSERPPLPYDPSNAASSNTSGGASILHNNTSSKTAKEFFAISGKPR